MRRNRDFMLLICGILIFLILGLAIANTTFNAIMKVKKDKQGSELNVGYSNSSITMYGLAVIESGAKVSGTNISKLEIIMERPGDEVRYSVRFCNNEDHPISYLGLDTNDLLCTNTISNSDEIKFCNMLEVSIDIVSGNKKIDVNDEISVGSCFDVNIGVKYPEKASYIINDPIKVYNFDYLPRFDKK